jgi:hypothetical protein
MVSSYLLHFMLKMLYYENKRQKETPQVPCYRSFLNLSPDTVEPSWLLVVPFTGLQSDNQRPSSSVLMLAQNFQAATNIAGLLALKL